MIILKEIFIKRDWLRSNGPFSLNMMIFSPWFASNFFLLMLQDHNVSILVKWVFCQIGLTILILYPSSHRTPREILYPAFHYYRNYIRYFWSHCITRDMIFAPVTIHHHERREIPRRVGQYRGSLLLSRSQSRGDGLIWPRICIDSRVSYLPHRW